MKKIILIGMKHSGKTTFAKELSKAIKMNFADTDIAIEHEFFLQKNIDLNCREIVIQHGEEYFRTLEINAVKNLLKDKKIAIIATGGGLANNKDILKMFKTHHIVHVKSPKSIVFERIMINGMPGFFEKEKSAFESFNEIWEKRMPIYENIADLTIDNSQNIEDNIKKIINTFNIKL